MAPRAHFRHRPILNTTQRKIERRPPRARSTFSLYFGCTSVAYFCDAFYCVWATIWAQKGVAGAINSGQEGGLKHDHKSLHPRGHTPLR